ncbi:hypothetical protein ScPMuIL_002172, partial [Solemya velum]
MDRNKQVQGKARPTNKAKVHAPPPGDLFALGKQGRSSSTTDSDVSKINTSGQKKLPPLAERKREAPVPAVSGLASKKPKLLVQGQTFTPLGRPSETERRVSPATVTPQFEESAIEVEPAELLDSIMEAEDDGNDVRVEGLLCGAVKSLRANRSKPDSFVYLTLMYLAKAKPAIYGSEIIIEAFCSLLKRDISLNFKAKGNPLVSVFACNVLMAAFAEEENWPDDFVK